MPLRWMYCAPFFVASLLMIVICVFAYHRRKVRGAWYLTLGCLSGAVWAMFEGMRYIGLDLKADMLVTYAQYLGVIPLGGLFLFFTLTVFGYERWVSRSVMTLFIIVTVTLVILVGTDPLHHLVYRRFYIENSGPFPIRAVQRGVLWWVITGYLYVFGAALGVLLIRIIASTKNIRRAQAGVILAALCIVCVVNLIYITGNSPVPDMDISPLSFILVAISMAWGFFRYNLLDVLPIAKAEIFQGLNTPILVLDQDNRILDLNPAAESLFEVQAAQFIGQKISAIPNKQPEMTQLLGYERQNEICIQQNGEDRYFNVSMSSLKNKRNMQIGRIITLYDDTERKLAMFSERERERLQGVLEMAGAVCHDLSQPVMAILGYVELMLNGNLQDTKLSAIETKLSIQAEKLSDMTKQLMSITRYETKDHHGNKIIDIVKASACPSDKK